MSQKWSSQGPPLNMVEATPLDAPLDEPTEFSTSLHFEVQISIAAWLLPAHGFGAGFAEWGNIMRLSAASNLVHVAVLEAVRELAPVALGSANLSPAAFALHVGALLAGGGQTRWKAVRSLRAVRPQLPNRTSLPVLNSYVRNAHMSFVGNIKGNI